MSRYVPINKGNYSMEIPEREALFEKNRGLGWEAEYKKYRDNWSSFPEKQFIAEYPLLVDLELSTVCNLKCPMCYTTTDEFKKKVKNSFMDFELYKKIIDEIAGKVPAIRLSLRGESTLHPNFKDAIKYAKDNGIDEVSTLTNASKLTPDFFREIMFAGIDWITISLDGMYEVYESIRKPLKFVDTLQKIKDIKLIKDEHNMVRPVIKIQTAWPAIREDPESFYNTFKPYVDLIAYNPLIDYLWKDNNIKYIEDYSCPQIYQRLVVGVDGKVFMCGFDELGENIIGDAVTESIYKIWHSEGMNKVRDIHRDGGGFFKIPLCLKCCLPRLTEDNEVAVVNGRSFYIQNYVNRQQTIGD